jgi:DNA-binding IclR family transcriptional regulator
MGPDRTHDGATRDAIVHVFRDASAVWTLDELARRFDMSLGEAIRVMSDLEAIDVVRRIGDEYVPGYGAATAS